MAKKLPECLTMVDDSIPSNIKTLSVEADGEGSIIRVTTPTAAAEIYLDEEQMKKLIGQLSKIIRDNR